MVYLLKKNIKNEKFIRKVHICLDFSKLFIVFLLQDINMTYNNWPNILIWEVYTF